MSWSVCRRKNFDAKIYFLAHLVDQPKSLIQSCFVHRRWHPALVSMLVSSVHTSSWHVVIHRNYIFGIHTHIYPPFMHTKYLLILTCSFKIAAILLFFFDLLFCPYRHRDFILHILMYLFLTFIHKRNNTTVTYFLKFMTIFLKFIYSLLLPHVF